MNVTKGADGALELKLTTDELGWFGQTLNECLGGFSVKDFNAAIGVSEDVVDKLLAQIRPMYHAPVGHEG